MAVGNPGQNIIGSHLARRTFTIEDQRHFAALTGDRNPIHLDPLIARRTLVGQMVVHGLHTAAWALESYLSCSSTAESALWHAGHLAATFPKPAFLGRDIDAYVVSAAEEAVHIRAVQDNVAVLELRLRSEETGNAGDGATPAYRRGQVSAVPRPPRSQPALRAEHELPGLHGSLGIVHTPVALREAFPASCATLGVPTVEQLLALSTLVGMECPGLHSLLSAVNVRLHPARTEDRPSAAGSLTYEVRRYAPAYALVDMAVQASGVAGSVMAFLRPPPAGQPTPEVVATYVAANEFAGQRALIIGGSRGLGELTAKIVAAGGGAPIVTYRHGRGDALGVAREIRSAGGTCEIAPFDVTQPERSMADIAEIITKEVWPPTHLYYFATPRIFARRTALFDEELFNSFTAFYVRGFIHTVAACSSLTEDGVRVLYPSSVAVEEALPELTEYAAAKAAGEAVANMLDRPHEAVRVVSVRLPRLPTDQTANVQQTPAEDPLPVMLEAIRSLDC